MSDLRERWDEFAERIGEARDVCALVDYDGTLTPIVERPEEARLSKVTRETLLRLASNPRAHVGVISGRSLADLLPRVDIERIWYVGNHGYEVRTPAGDTQCFYEAADVLLLNGVRDELATETAGIDGVQLEHKGPTIALHYRRVDPARVVEVERAFLHVVERHRRAVMMGRGRCVLEARLRGNCNKGTALRFIRRQLPSATFIAYFGDDITDRDAFRALKGLGVSVQVGTDDPGLADYTLPDPAAVVGTLLRIDERLRARATRVRRRDRR